MPPQHSGLWLHRRRVILALVFYTTALMASAYLHHDFACHQKSRTHCTACAHSQFAARTDLAGSTVNGPLPQAGQLERFSSRPLDKLFPTRSLGRSPPA